MCSLLVGSGLIRVRQGKFGTGVLFLSERGNGKWIVNVNRIRVEMIWKGSKEQLVHAASVINIQIVIRFGEAPIREDLWMVGQCVESVASDKSSSI